jgi:hypothetical protein
VEKMFEENPSLETETKKNPKIEIRSGKLI